MLDFVEFSRVLIEIGENISKSLVSEGIQILIKNHNPVMLHHCTNDKKLWKININKESILLQQTSRINTSTEENTSEALDQDEWSASSLSSILEINFEEDYSVEAEEKLKTFNSSVLWIHGNKTIHENHL